MRGAFIRTLVELAEQDPRILLLTADLGYMAVEPFAEKFPDRFFNVGVAEQNMIGVATGLAEAGYIPFTYSIVTFAALRSYEFIRNGPIVHQLPVRIVGVGGGFEYGTNGITHYGLDDVGVLAVQPGVTVIAPADHLQTKTALKATWDMPGPVYYRLGKDDKTVVPGLDGRFELRCVQCIRETGSVLMLAMGGVSTEVIAAADLLAEQGIPCAVGVVASMRPPPVDDLAEMLQRYDAVITVEAHYSSGGLGSLVAEVIAEGGLRCRLIRRAVKRLPGGVSGSQDFMYRTHGLSRQALAEVVLQAIEPDMQTSIAD